METCDECGLLVRNGEDCQSSHCTELRDREMDAYERFVLHCEGYI